MALIINPAINGDTYQGGGSWTNSDGLTIYYGTQEAWLAGGGEYGAGGYVSGQMVTDHIINLSALVTANPTLLTRNLFPNNFVLDKAELFVETVAASSGSGTLNIGLWDFTAAATISDTAVVAAATTAILSAGAMITVIAAPAGSTALGSTYAGTKMGLVAYNWVQPPVVATPQHQIALTAKAGTAVFQSGVVRLRLYAHRSLASDTFSPGGDD